MDTYNIFQQVPLVLQRKTHQCFPLLEFSCIILDTFLFFLSEMETFHVLLLFMAERIKLTLKQVLELPIVCHIQLIIHFNDIHIIFLPNQSMYFLFEFIYINFILIIFNISHLKIYLHLIQQFVKLFCINLPNKGFKIKLNL